MILRRLFSSEGNSAPVQDSVCFVAAAIRESRAIKDEEFPKRVDTMSSDPVSFSMQLANLQHSLQRANQPSVVMMPMLVSERVN